MLHIVLLVLTCWKALAFLFLAANCVPSSDPAVIPSLPVKGSQAVGVLTRSDRQGSVDDRSDSAMLESRPSGPLIQDPSGVYAYGSGKPLTSVMLVASFLYL